MTHARHEHRDLTVACDLDPDDARTRIAEWQAVRDRHELGAEQIAGGARLWLRAAAAPAIEDLVQREARCCGFLNFDLGPDGDRMRLEITSPAPQGAQVAAFLAGLGRDPSLPCC